MCFSRSIKFISCIPSPFKNLSLFSGNISELQRQSNKLSINSISS
ncbi:unnamed protein product [Schistosoma curassoni]|uniref:Uncharacterized protein n=1 Tax=Schistosoma curassoni TaxID=6186 RepID=A0A183KMG0_9TREM|nr:unnamed protein product [Schistosoma curassoni]